MLCVQYNEVMYVQRWLLQNLTVRVVYEKRLHIYTFAPRFNMHTFSLNFNLDNQKAEFCAYCEKMQIVKKKSWKKFLWIFCIFVNWFEISNKFSFFRYPYNLFVE
jgi:hypothetical protein